MGGGGHFVGSTPYTYVHVFGEGVYSGAWVADDSAWCPRPIVFLDDVVDVTISS